MQYVGYYRVSTRRQGESGLGLEAQQAIVRHFAGDGLAADYTEVASGSGVDKRPVLGQALSHCRESGAWLVVAKADRLSRNVQDALSILDRLDGRLLCCDCPHTDRFTLTLLFALAERERELISIRTKAALDAKRRREGRQKINGRSKGVDTSTARKAALASRREKARLLARDPALYALQWLRAGRSLSEVARYLNALIHLFPTPSGTGRWTACQVARAITRWTQKE